SNPPCVRWSANRIISALLTIGSLNFYQEKVNVPFLRVHSFGDMNSRIALLFLLMEGYRVLALLSANSLNSFCTVIL
ncbi:MAG: hypothetical protein AAF696_28145, partial [Bacteroidota bacterium]